MRAHYNKMSILQIILHNSFKKYSSFKSIMTFVLSRFKDCERGYKFKLINWLFVHKKYRFTKVALHGDLSNNMLIDNTF